MGGEVRGFRLVVPVTWAGRTYAPGCVLLWGGRDGPRVFTDRMWQTARSYWLLMVDRAGVDL